MTVHGDVADQILAREHERQLALLAGDVAALTELLSRRLLFTHANGTSDNKDTLLAKIAAGTVRYATLTLENPEVVPLGDGAALLTGRLLAELEVRGATKTVCNLVLSVWVREEGRWRMLAYQPTPVPN